MSLHRTIGIVFVAVVLWGCQSMAPAVTPAGPVAATPSGTSVASPDHLGSGALSGSPIASAPPLPTAPGVKILVDTDVAPDDLVAISFLVAAPNVEIAAITVSGTGEVHCPGGVSIVLGLLERLHAPDIPVACGSDRPIALDHAFPTLFRDNADAAAGLGLPTTTRQVTLGGAVTLITTAAASGAGGLRILTLGPLTNLAEAIAATPALAGQLESVYVMGGAVDVPGNIAGSPDAPAGNTTAEWNIYVDPAAAAGVLGAGSPVRFVSLDGTNQVPVTPAFGQRVATSVTGAALSVLAELFAKNDYMTGGGYYLWDTVAAIAAAGYPVGDFTDVRLSVDTTNGPASGRTLRADGPSNASYMTRADAATIEALIIDVMSRD